MNKEERQQFVNDLCEELGTVLSYSIAQTVTDKDDEFITKLKEQIDKIDIENPPTGHETALAGLSAFDRIAERTEWKGDNKIAKALKAIIGLFGGSDKKLPLFKRLRAKAKVWKALKRE